MSLWELLPVGWQVHLQNIELSLARIDQELVNLNALGIDIAPTKSYIFAALPESPEAVRVVIVGQDPYPKNGHATGLAFSVPAGTQPLPPTLRNILVELHEDISTSWDTRDDLSAWRDQGVLLLNRVLTTEVGESLAHAHLGWQEISSEIVRTVLKVNPAAIGVLWGKQAQELAKEFSSEFLVRSVHPSPLSAYRGFFGSRPFSAVNRLLIEKGQSPINW